MHGELLWFNEERGDGMIRTDDGQQVAVLREGFADGLGPVGRCRGTRVAFELAQAEGGVQAVSVSVLPIEAARRARLRGRK